MLDMPIPTELEDLRGKRVRVVFHDEEDTHGILEGITAEKVWLAGQTWIDRFEVNRIEPALFTCEVCGGEGNTIFDGKCASCVRKEAAKAPPQQEPCERCGRPGVRQPGTDVFMCTQHHAEAGHSLRLNGSAADVLAECYTADVDSDKHDWRPVRGARFRCVRCRNAEKWDPELLRQLRDAR